MGCLFLAAATSWSPVYAYFAAARLFIVSERHRALVQRLRKAIRPLLLQQRVGVSSECLFAPAVSSLTVPLSTAREILL